MVYSYRMARAARIKCLGSLLRVRSIIITLFLLKGALYASNRGMTGVSSGWRGTAGL